MKELLHRLQKMAIDNSPTILSAMAVTTSVATAYLTGRASFRAARLISEHSAEEALMRREPELRENLELVWKLYVPAAGTGIATIVLIICANRVGTRRAAAMAAAFSLSERAFEEYRDKIVERIGDKKEQQYRDEIVQEHIRKNTPSTEVILASHEVLCRDEYSGRYFNGTVEKIRAAENVVNYMVVHDYSASLTDFYNEIGLERTSMSDDVGWNVNRLLEVNFTSGLTADNVPCLAIHFRVEPTREYTKF